MENICMNIFLIDTILFMVCMVFGSLLNRIFMRKCKRAHKKRQRLLQKFMFFLVILYLLRITGVPIDKYLVIGNYNWFEFVLCFTSFFCMVGFAFSIPIGEDE